MKNPERRPYIYGMLAGFGAISLSVVLFFLLYRLQGVGAALDTVIGILMPFIYGGVIAYLLRPMCNWYSQKLHQAFRGKYPKLAEGLAIILSLLSGLLIVYMLIIMIAPQLYYSIVSLWNTIPEKVEKMLAWFTEAFGENEVMLQYFNTSYKQVYDTMESWARDTLLPYVTNIVSGVGMSVWKVLLFFKDLLIGLIAAVYLLASRKRFGRQSVLVIRSVLRPKWADMLLEEIAIVDKMFGGFIEGKLVDSAIIGVLCYIGCSIFKFPNALLVSAIVGVTNVIPFFGPFLGAIPATLLILIENPIKALWFVLFVVILQQIDGNIIGPKILGDHTGVSSFWVLFSILLFGGLWGLVGMIIAVPLFAVIYDILKKLVIRGLKRNGCAELLDHYAREFGDQKDKSK
ncbi:MAG: AI-2E family transporter [Oscillospiraceae bacterium]|nr:AI-2E family transporter [Oscillospiraceae bacterium]